MSERYNVQASDVLGENYKITSVECSDYNPSIDGNITVTITVNDVYQDPISDENVTVTASEGTFIQLNGSDITSASSVTGTTNSSGQFTLTYACSEWGLITFSANNTNNQINVIGWKTYYSDSNYVIKYNENYVLLKITYQGLNPTTSYKQFGNAALVSSALLPECNHFFHDPFHQVGMYISDDTGNLYYKSITGSSLSNQRVFCSTMWKHI